LTVVVVAACTGSASAALVNLAVGHWECTVRDTSAHHLDPIEVRVDVARNHRLTLDMQQPRPQPHWLAWLTGSWQLHGTSVTVDLSAGRDLAAIFKKSHLGEVRFDGATKATRAVSMFANGTRQSRFAVALTDNQQVTFRQTESNGSPSVASGGSDAYVVACTKALLG